MRIVQIIDSLEPGGAEKMAVSYANALSKRIEFSGIVATRKEGNLKQFIDKNVDYCFLNKKKSIEINSLFKLYKYLKNNRVEVVQAHSTSFFSAVLIKIMMPKLKIVWHDHYGKSIENRENTNVIRWFSVFFAGIISVNENLKNWAKDNTFCKKIIRLNNFVMPNEDEIVTTHLSGIQGKRVLCLANFREQKNQLLLIEVAKVICQKYPDWTFHLVGKNFKDAYFQEIKTKIQQYNLINHVFCYHDCTDIFNIIKQSDIAVLSSLSEGLPVALLEYGLCSKAVISTTVGEIPKIINEHNGILVKTNAIENFVTQLENLILAPDLRINLGTNLHQTICDNYTENVVVETYLNWIKNV